MRVSSPYTTQSGSVVADGFPSVIFVPVTGACLHDVRGSRSGETSAGLQRRAVRQ